ncbi:MAG: lipocalin family protein [Bdellovibrionaceae bacterium]|nr:lipocalin family protein [Pseudobdellovibrionaceae bacterium]
MKLISVLLISILMSSFTVFAKSNIKTLESVEISKFLGTWYRISSNPVIFEPRCKCARQIISAQPNGVVSVHNSCVKDDKSGKLLEIKGTASALDSSASKLAVDFGLPWKGSYWIIGFDPLNGYAVVSDKWGYSLYIMSRNPDMDKNLYSHAVNVAKRAGVKTNRLRIQDNSTCENF